MNKNVLVFAEYGSINGGENSFLTAASLISQRGWTYQIACPAESDFEEACRALGFDTVNFSYTLPDGTRKSQEEIRRQATELIQQVKPALVHCNSLSTGRLFGPVTAATKTPSLGYLRDIIKISKKAIADLNELDRIVAVSEATRQFHVGQGLDPTKAIFIHNGILLDQFRPGSEQFEKRQSHHLLFVGQIGMRKGIEVLLEAVEICSEQISGIELFIVGQRHSQKQEAIEYEASLIQQGARINESGRAKVHWLGRRTDVAELMRKCDLLVHPARQEPLGRVLLEAFASGLPVVATDVGGTPEIFEGLEAFDLMVPKDDADAMAARISKVLSGPSDEIRKAVRRIAETRFSVEKTANHLENEYEQLAKHHAGRNESVETGNG